jgi:hypothetical protein
MIRSTAAFFLLLAAITPALAQTSETSPTSTWAFEPAKDDFKSDALLDLRSLNEKVAGESGFVTVNAEGDFILGNGQPARFWAINTFVGGKFTATPLGRQEAPDLARHARFLAKRGVNMVRLHSHLNPEPDQGINDVNRSEIDRLQRVVAAMKAEGIYTTLSPFWAIAKHGPSWGLDDKGGDLFGLLFFDKKLQEAYRGWLKELLVPNNPHTGIPLAADPALAVIQLQNEDSLLFWTAGTIKSPHKEKLAALYGTFLAKKHGSLEAAFKLWGGDKMPLDEATAGTADFRGLWELGQPRQPGGASQRLTDQLEFVTETMRRFNEETIAYLRNELGCKQLVNPGNWITADPIRLTDAERYSYTPGEVLAVNRYFTGVHQGKNNGWAIENGDRFTNISALTTPREFPLNLKQVVGKAMIMPESSWTFPNGRGAEGPFLIAAYGSLTGSDGYCWFSTGDDEWTPPQSANGYMASQGKWQCSTPDMMGTFPAAALMHRRGYIKRGAPAVVEQRSVEDIYTGTVPIIAEAASFDPNRQTGSFAPQNNFASGVDPLAFFVGPVQVVYGGEASKSHVVDLSKYLDSAAKTVTSIAGELQLNHQLGWCTLNAPKAQGVAAFFGKKPTFQLQDVEITSRNEHGSVLLVSMDNQPLATSGKILVQAGMGCRPTDWVEEPTEFEAEGTKFQGLEVKNFGKAPWQVNRADVTVTLRNTKVSGGKILDANGNAAGDVKLERLDKGVRFAFPPDALYVVLR